MAYSFSKDERLKKKKYIKRLFEQGKSLYLYPLRIIYLPCHDGAITKHQALFTVSRKKLPHAVLRNRVKRRLREAHRLAKHLLDNLPPGTCLFIGYIYIGNTLSYSFATLQKQVHTALHQLSQL